MDIIERLRDDAMWIDATDDAIMEIESLRYELAQARRKLRDAKRPPNGTAPSATRTQHERIPSPGLGDILKETEREIAFAFTGLEWRDVKAERERTHRKMVGLILRAYEAGQEGSDD